jgi:hypothetical protein
MVIKVFGNVTAGRLIGYPGAVGQRESCLPDHKMIARNQGAPEHLLALVKDGVTSGCQTTDIDSVTTFRRQPNM